MQRLDIAAMHELILAKFNQLPKELKHKHVEVFHR